MWIIAFIKRLRHGQVNKQSNKNVKFIDCNKSSCGAIFLAIFQKVKKRYCHDEHE